MLSQVLAHKANEDDFQNLEACLARMTAMEICLTLLTLDIASFEVLSYADSFFANNLVQSSQIGYFFFDVDKDEKCAFVAWCS